MLQEFFSNSHSIHKLSFDGTDFSAKHAPGIWIYNYLWLSCERADPRPQFALQRGASFYFCWMGWSSFPTKGCAHLCMFLSNLLNRFFFFLSFSRTTPPTYQPQRLQHKVSWSNLLFMVPLIWKISHMPKLMNLFVFDIWRDKFRKCCLKILN